MFSRNCTNTIGRSSLALEGVLGTFARRGWQRIRRFPTLYQSWRRRARLRGYLAQMTDYELTDIGLSRGDAEREANLPFWRHMELGRH